MKHGRQYKERRQFLDFTESQNYRNRVEGKLAGVCMGKWSMVGGITVKGYKILVTQDE
jgi:hypothetical protein